MIASAFGTKDKVGRVIVYGKSTTRNRFFRDIVVGLIIGSVLISGYLGFSIAISPAPFSIVGSSTTTANLITLVIIGFFGVEAEEMFRASILVPSILGFTGKEGRVASILSGIILFVLVVLFLFLQIFGVISIYVTLLLIGLGVAVTLKHVKKNTKQSFVLDHMIAILFGATIFMMLHVFAYGSGSYTTDLPAFAAAFSFAVVADIVNWILQSTLSSRMSHSVNNCVLGCTALGLSLVYGALVIAIYAGLLYISAFGFNKSIARNDLRNVAFGG